MLYEMFTGRAAFAGGTLHELVRRFWPQSVVSWSRLLAGRIRDPVVGRDIQVGVACAAAAVLVAGAIATFVHDARLGEGAAFLGALDDDALLGLRRWVAVLLGAGLRGP